MAYILQQKLAYIKNPLQKSVKLHTPHGTIHSALRAPYRIPGVTHTQTQNAISGGHST